MLQGLPAIPASYSRNNRSWPIIPRAFFPWNLTPTNESLQLQKAKTKICGYIGLSSLKKDRNMTINAWKCTVVWQLASVLWNSMTRFFALQIENILQGQSLPDRNIFMEKQKQCQHVCLWFLGVPSKGIDLPRLVSPTHSTKRNIRNHQHTPGNDQWSHNVLFAGKGHHLLLTEWPQTPTVLLHCKFSDSFGLSYVRRHLRLCRKACLWVT